MASTKRNAQGLQSPSYLRLWIWYEVEAYIIKAIWQGAIHKGCLHRGGEEGQPNADSYGQGEKEGW